MISTSNTDSLKRTRTIFILSSMAIAVLMLALSAYFFHGWKSAAWWGFGFSAIYLLYAILYKDSLVFSFLLFGISAGITELIADYWLVYHTKTLFYPVDEPMIWASPAYMPFSWLVVIIQIGFIGTLINQKLSLWKTSIAVGILGCMIIPLYEYFAIRAEWWYYDNSPMWGNVPIYIFVAEGLLMLSIPWLFNRCEKSKSPTIVLLGIIQGLVMLLACIIAFNLVG